MPRTFVTASSEKIDLSLGGGGSVTGATTLAAIIRTSSDGSALRTFLRIGSTGTPYVFYRDASNKIGTFTATALPTSTTTLTVSDGWAFVAVTKSSGTTTPRFHIYKYRTNTWAHEAGSASQVSASPGGSSAIGSNVGSQYWNGDVAAAGVWAAELTDAQVEPMAYSLAAWWAVQPNGLWVLDQSATSQKVVDLTGNGANESGITGTAVSTGAVPVWSYGHPVQVERITVTAISLALTPAEVTVTPVALGVTPGTASVAMTPAEVTVTPVAFGVTPGTVTLALTPAELTVTAQALGLTPGTVSLILTPANVTVTPVALGIVSVQTVVVTRWAAFREATTATYREDTRADYREN